MNMIPLFLLAGCLFATCTPKPDATSNQPASVTVSVLLDKTDPRLYWPSASQLLSLFHCEQKLDAAFSFRLSAISDVVQNKRIIRTLPAAEHERFTLASVSRQKRSQAILRLYSAVRKDMEDFYSRNDTSSALQHSVCALPILSELQYLAEHATGQRNLVVASDLREFSSFNMYAIDSLTSDMVTSWLATLQSELPSLEGITVLFVFMSRNPSEDNAFYTIANGYKHYLESKGAQVFIKPNLE